MTTLNSTPEQATEVIQSIVYGVLKLTPTRVELWAGQDMMLGRPPTVWKEKA